VHLAAELAGDRAWIELRAAEKLFADGAHQFDLRLRRQTMVVAALRAGAAGPQRFLGDLQAFGIDRAEDHRTDAAVADRQRFLFPILRGLVVPHQGRLLGAGGRAERRERDAGS
jgi:hypothetical protein